MNIYKIEYLLIHDNLPYNRSSLVGGKSLEKALEKFSQQTTVETEVKLEVTNIKKLGSLIV